MSLGLWDTRVAAPQSLGWAATRKCISWLPGAAPSGHTTDTGQTREEPKPQAPAALLAGASSGGDYRETRQGF